MIITARRLTIGLFLLALSMSAVSSLSSASEPVEPITRSEFYHLFSDNENLTGDDLAIFPEEVQDYLLHSFIAKGREVSGFSKLIDSGTYLFVVNKKPVSRAILVHTSHTRSVSPNLPLQWRRLFLPFLPNEMGIEVNDLLFNLRWNSDLGLLQSHYCNDVGPVCSRSTYQVYFSNSRLIKVELLQRVKSEGKWVDNWKAVWDRGRWLIDKYKPHNPDKFDPEK